MNNIINYRTWDEVKEKIKEANVDVTDADLTLMHGDESELFERLAKKLNKSAEEVKEWIGSIASNKTIAG